jgi:hypothetical protein
VTSPHPLGCAGPESCGPLRRFSDARDARNRRRSAGSSRRVVLPLRVLSSRDVTAPIGLRGAPSPFGGLGVLASRPLPESVSFREDPLAGLDPFRSLTHASPQPREPESSCACAFRGLVPFSVCRPGGATTSGGTHPPVWLRPQGFSPSRRFAPRLASPGLFHPGSALGVSVLRGFPPPTSPYVLSHAGPSRGVCTVTFVAAAPSGVLHVAGSASEGPGIGRIPWSGASMDFPLRGVLPAGGALGLAETKRCAIPSYAWRYRRTGRRHAGGSGC